MRTLRPSLWRPAPLATFGFLALVVALAGCGSSSTSSGNTTNTATPTLAAATATSAPTAAPTATTGGSETDIRIGGGPGTYNFNPASVTIKVGTTVVWKNNTGAPHTSTSDSGSAVMWDSGQSLFTAGGTFSFTFTTPGTYNYHCSVHTFMKGTIVVTS